MFAQCQKHVWYNEGFSPQSVDKFAQIPSFRRKPESRGGVQILRDWIPAFAGMTMFLYFLEVPNGIAPYPL